jgi:hypothetical protein
VAGGIRLPISDIAVEFRGRPGGTEVHEAKPVGNAPPDVLGSLDVPVHDDREPSRCRG